MADTSSNTIPLCDCKYIKRGDYIELTENFLPIPAGIYKLAALDNTHMTLRIGQRVTFMLPISSFHRLAKIKDKLKAKLTTAEDFADRYYMLMQLMPYIRDTFDPSQGMTMCALDPSLERQVH